MPTALRPSQPREFHTPPFGATVLRLLAAGSAYAFLSIVYTWPLAVRITSTVPSDPIDPVSLIWVIWWNIQHVPFTTAWAGQGIFWPITDAIAFQDTMLSIHPLAVVLSWAGLSPLGIYNVAFIASHALAAFTAFLLCRIVTRDDASAFVGGLFFGFGLYRLAQFSHLNILLDFLLPLCFLLAVRYATTSRLWLAVACGALLAVQGMTAGYWFVYGSIFVAVAALFLMGGVRQQVRFACAALAGGMIALPWATYYWGVHQRYMLRRPIQEVAHFSASLESLGAVAPHSAVYGSLMGSTSGESQFFVGLVAICLLAAGAWLWLRQHPFHWGRLSAVLLGIVAVAAIVGGVAWFAPGSYRVAGVTIGLAKVDRPLGIACWLTLLAFLGSTSVREWRRERSVPGFFTVSALVAWVLSLGPAPVAWETRFWYKAPYALLMELPGFESVRVPARLWIIATLCLAVLMALSVRELSRLLVRRSGHALSFAAALLLFAEAWPAMPLVSPPAESPSFVAASGVDAVFELPSCELAGDAAAMYRSMQHGKPVLNGYSGYRPYWYSLLCQGLEDGSISSLRDVFSEGRVGLLLRQSEEASPTIAHVIEGSGATLATREGEWSLYTLTLDGGRADDVDPRWTLVHPHVTVTRGARNTVAAEGRFEEILWPDAASVATDLLVTLPRACSVHGLRIAGELAPAQVALRTAATENGGWWRGSVVAAAARSNLLLGHGVLIDVAVPAKTVTEFTLSLDAKPGPWALESIGVWTERCD